MRLIPPVMEPEMQQAFACGRGRVTPAWAVEFFAAESRPELGRWSRQVEDGSIMEGTIGHTLETLKVRFPITPEALQVETRGHISRRRLL